MCVVFFLSKSLFTIIRVTSNGSLNAAAFYGRYISDQQLDELAEFWNLMRKKLDAIESSIESAAAANGSAQIFEALGDVFEVEVEVSSDEEAALNESDAQACISTLKKNMRALKVGRKKSLQTSNFFNLQQHRFFAATNATISEFRQIVLLHRYVSFFVDYFC